MKMLLRNRADLVLVSDLDLRSVLENANIDETLIQSTSVSLYQTEDSLAFSNQVSDDIVNKWGSVLSDIKLSGRYDELASKYLYPK